MLEVSQLFWKRLNVRFQQELVLQQKYTFDFLGNSISTGNTFWADLLTCKWIISEAIGRRKLEFSGVGGNLKIRELEFGGDMF